jgi:hypothetical protein
MATINRRRKLQCCLLLAPAWQPADKVLYKTVLIWPDRVKVVSLCVRLCGRPRSSPTGSGRIIDRLLKKHSTQGHNCLI